MKNTIVTFGEIMGRLCPEGYQRFLQSMPGKLDITFAGAEANVAASIALLGGNTRFVSALPENSIGNACLHNLRALGVDTSHIISSPSGRMGLYFIEKGANQRPSNVIYDRENSTLALTDPAQYRWNEAFAKASWFHVTGITPAVSQAAYNATLDAAKSAKNQGLTISCDLNFRKKLWQWDPTLNANELAESCMREILPFVDVLVANEADAADVLGIQADQTDVESGSLDFDRYPAVASEIVRQFPAIQQVAITLRESISASHNNWGAMMYDASNQQAHFAPTNDNGCYEPYEIRSIIDRVGGGDSFAAGLIFALNTPEFARPAIAIRFAAAASCLAHSIEGDFNYVSRNEVENLMGGSASGRISR